MSLANDLEKLAAKATPGPWKPETESEDNCDRYMQEVYVCHPGTVCSSTVVAMMGDTEGRPLGQKQADAALIVALHNALPTILSALREREAVTDWLRGHSIAGDHLASRIEAGEHMKGKGQP
jgi:hypothetical protein